MGLLVAVWADVDAEIFVGFVGIVCWDGDFGVVGCGTVVDAYVDWRRGCFCDLVSAVRGVDSCKDVDGTLIDF